MRNIIIIILIVFSTGCKKDLLETIPNDRISSDIYWKTDKDAEYAANAIYPYLIHSMRDFMYWDGMSDIAHITLTWQLKADISKNTYDATHGAIESEWDYNFRGIQAANRFLANVGKIETTNPELVAQYTAEVKVLRAFLYIKMTMLFGKVPLITEELSLDESWTVSGTPIEQIWNFIAEDLTEAANDLPVKTTNAGRITRGAALALKARAMLYAGHWTEAANAAKSVMDLGVYSLYPNYKDLFTNEAQNSSESILSRQYATNIQSHNIYTLVSPASISNITNESGIVPTKQIVDSYEMADGKHIDDPASNFDPYNPYFNRDPRLRYSIFLPGDTLPNGSIYDPRPGSGTADEIGTTQDATPTGFNLKKYFIYSDRSDPSNCGINIMLIRYSEVLLTYAEAKIEMNDIDQTVIDAINLVRNGRVDVNQPDISIGEQSEMRNLVRHERMVELAFEGLRYFDIRRWRIAETVIPGPIYGMTYEDDNGELRTIVNNGFIREFNPDRDYLWPIPDTEVKLNGNLGQNPNW